MVTPARGGCTAAYSYHGVVAREERAATTFGRFGTAPHAMVMRRDALDGLVRRATGRPLDDAWRESVRTAIGDGRAGTATLRRCDMMPGRRPIGCAGPARSPTIRRSGRGRRHDP